VESRPNRGWNVCTDVSGLPDIVMAGGHTTEVHDRLPGPASHVLRDVIRPSPSACRAAVLEAGLLEIASHSSSRPSTPARASGLHGHGAG